MSGFRILALAAVAGFMLTATPPKAAAQITVDIGVAPDCPYGCLLYTSLSSDETVTEMPWAVACSQRSRMNWLPEVP